MTKFLIQFENNIPAYDFCYETIKSIEYHNWLEEKEKYSYKPWSLDQLQDRNQLLWTLDCRDMYIPIGSVEFVHKYMELCNIPIPPPINIPEELFSLCIQEPLNVSPTEKMTTRWEFFAKSNNLIKHPHNGLTKKLILGNWQTTKPIDIISEWRCFIFKEKLIDFKCYSGDQFLIPTEKYINQCIKTYKSAPIAYTLDIAVTNPIHPEFDSFNLVDTVIECHDFYSCGFYGFSGKYPMLMHSAWWKEYLNKCKKS